MNIFAKISLAAATVALISGCVHPLMCQRDAIDASNRRAEVAGYYLADYQHPKAEFFYYPHPVSQKPVQEWVVSYTPKIEMWTTNAHGEHWVTNFLSISVDCKTGAAKFNKTDWEPD
jgi:hypothetical protein